MNFLILRDINNALVFERSEKMNTRIRYEQDGPWLVSARVFTANGKSYRVKLNIVEMIYQIVDVETGGHPISGGGTKNLAVLKRTAKRALKDLGYNFGEEKRNRINKRAVPNPTA